MATLDDKSLNPLSNLYCGSNGQFNWVEAVDQEHIRQAASAPKRSETEKDGIRTVVDIITDKDNVKSKVITTYKVITKKVPRDVAERRKWKKFGLSANDKPGPQVHTTYVADEVEMQFIRTRLDERHDEYEEKSTDPILKGASKGHCRFCKSDEHWSINCPYKDMYQNINEEEPDVQEKPGFKHPGIGTSGGKYVNPIARGDRVIPERRDDYTVRVTNLPEDSDTLDKELRDLFSSIGKVERFYLAKDKITNKPKGFAFISYSNRLDAEKAIAKLNCYKMNHLVMKVEWTK